MVSVRRFQGTDIAKDTRSDLLFSRSQIKGCPNAPGGVGSDPKVWIWGVCLHPRGSGEVKGGDLPSSTSHMLWS